MNETNSAFEYHGSQRGQMVSASHFQQRDRGFESHTDHFLDLFLGSDEPVNR